MVERKYIQNKENKERKKEKKITNDVIYEKMKKR